VAWVSRSCDLLTDSYCPTAETQWGLGRSCPHGEASEAGLVLHLAPGWWEPCCPGCWLLQRFAGENERSVYLFEYNPEKMEGGSGRASGDGPT
jgi:hypothetical protein